MRALVAGPLVSAAIFAVALPARAQQEQAPRAVVVHLSGSPDAALEQRVGDTWVEICKAPCDRAMPAGLYRIGGDGVRESSSFVLSGDRSDRTTLNVHAAPQGRFLGGAWLVGGGSFAVLLGVAVSFAAILGSGGCSFAADFSSSEMCPDNAWIFYTGVGIAAAGAISIASGIVLMATNAHSSVTQSVGPSASIHFLGAANTSAPIHFDEQRVLMLRSPSPPIQPILSIAF